MRLDELAFAPGILQKAVAVGIAENFSVEAEHGAQLTFGKGHKRLLRARAAQNLSCYVGAQPFHAGKCQSVYVEAHR